MKLVFVAFALAACGVAAVLWVLAGGPPQQSHDRSMRAMGQEYERRARGGNKP